MIIMIEIIHTQLINGIIARVIKLLILRILQIPEYICPTSCPLRCSSPRT